MSELRALPPHPDLRRLRDEAKARQRGGEFATLAGAQFAIAREHGFASWPRLKTYVETRALDMTARGAALVRSACSSDLRTARVLLDAEPGLARYDLATACVTGDVAEVTRRIEREPGIAGRKLAPLEWEPLLYACFSRFLRADPDRAEGIVAVVRILLDAGADPNVMWFDGEFRELPIYGAAGIANNPVLTQMLLDAGADPNETYQDPEPIGEALYHAAEFGDLTCARLLIEAGTLPNRVSYCLGRALDFANPAMAEMFLAHGATPTGQQLREAVTNGRPARLVAGLLDAGAPVNQADRNGMTALRIAVQWGRTDLADLLTARGADLSSVTDADRSISAVVTGRGTPDGATAVIPPPDLLDRAAHTGDVDAVRRLLAAGASVDGSPEFEIRPLGQAAWRGHADVVRELVARGAELGWPDGSAIGAALHGSLHCHDAEGGPTMRTVDEIDHGDYPEVVRILLDAGAPVPERLRDPGLDVAALLARLGISDPGLPTPGPETPGPERP
jgi:ankyrin repeat protein